MTPEEQAIVDAVSAKLAGKVYVGARARFQDGVYTVTARGVEELLDYGRTRVQWWKLTREDGRPLLAVEEVISARLV